MQRRPTGEIRSRRYQPRVHQTDGGAPGSGDCDRLSPTRADSSPPTCRRPGRAQVRRRCTALARDRDSRRGTHRWMKARPHRQAAMTAARRSRRFIATTCQRDNWSAPSPGSADPPPTGHADKARARDARQPWRSSGSWEWHATGTRPPSPGAARGRHRPTAARGRPIQPNRPDGPRQRNRRGRLLLLSPGRFSR